MPRPDTATYNRLNRTHRAVVNAIHADNGNATSDYISNFTGLDKTTVRAVLLVLLRDGTIRTVNAGTATPTYSCCGG